MSAPLAPERRVGVLGALVWDTLHPWPPGSPAITAWGGLSYALLGFDAALLPGWRFTPLSIVGHDRAAEASALLASLPKRAPGAAFATSHHPTNQVTLRYHSPAERHEHQLALIPPWELDALLPHLSQLQALYINFLSGFELTLPTLEALRSALPELFIYGDLHSLTLGIDADGHRSLRLPPEHARWLACFDALQMNAAEAALFDPLGGLLPLLTPLPRPRLLAVTRGAEGASLSTRRTNADAWDTLLASPPAVAALDPTGCGDVFGATLCASLLADLPLPYALRRANTFAAAAATTVGASPDLRAALTAL